MRHFFSATWILLLSFTLLTCAQPVTAGALETSQVSDEISISSPAIFTTPGKVNTIIPLSDGRVLIGGQFITIGGQSAPYSLAIMKSDGMLDGSFQVDADLQIYEIYAAALQSDGKIVISGWFNKLPISFTYFLLRLNPNGTVDDTFHTTQVNSKVYSILMDGEKILIGGNFTQPGSYITRLNQDGTVDTAFNGIGSGPSHAVWGIARQSNGKYIIAGEFSSINGTAQLGIARLSHNGALDAAFAPGGFRASKQLAVLNNDTVVVGSENICGEGVFAWYTPDGVSKPTPAVDPNLLQSITSFLPLPDGGFLLGGWYSVGCFNTTPLQHQAQVWRYAADGSYHTMTSFGDDSDVLALALRTDGKVILGGQGRPTESNMVGAFDGMALLDLANDGLETVPSFQPIVGDEAEIYSLSRYTDGKLLVAGNFSHVNGSPRFGLARLLSNGTLDPDFHPFAERPGGWSLAALALPDGRSVAGFGDSNLYLIAKDGGLTDLSAIINYDRVSVLARQADGKILVGSNFGLGVRRLKSDLSGLDGAFVPGDAYGSVYALAVQPDQKILVAGDFTKFNNVDAPGLVRLKTDGSLDTSFVPPVFMLDEFNTAALYDVTPLSNEKMLVGGNFSTVGGSEHPALVRLNSNGGLDPDFTSPENAFSVKSSCVQGDGSLWIGGTDATFNRNPFVSHLDSTGQLDTTVTNVYRSAHADGTINALLCDAGGLGWAGGVFSLIDHRPSYGVARYVFLWGNTYLPFTWR